MQPHKKAMPVVREMQEYTSRYSAQPASSDVLSRLWKLTWIGVAALCCWPIQAGDAVANPAVARKPQRIVSLNLCVDQILVDLVSRRRIRALSHLATDPSVSAIAGKARGLVTTRGDPEEVVRFNPDLVIAGTFTTKATTNLLTRLGLRVLVMPLAQDFAGIRLAVRTIAAAVGEPDRGAVVVARFDRKLSDLSRQRPVGRRPTALVYGVNGITAPPGTLADAVLRAAGLRNGTADRHMSAAATVPLEALVARPPQLIVLVGAADEFRSAAADNLRHPALRWLLQQRASIRIPRALWLCGSPHVADAVVRLAIAARKLSVLQGQP